MKNKEIGVFNGEIKNIFFLGKISDTDMPKEIVYDFLLYILNNDERLSKNELNFFVEKEDMEEVKYFLQKNISNIKINFSIFSNNTLDDGFYLVNNFELSYYVSVLMKRNIKFCMDSFNKEILTKLGAFDKNNSDIEKKNHSLLN